VGDSHREDYWGASNAGYSAALLDRDGNEAEAIATLATLYKKLQ
jgi:hypothetical protein